jgi:hypothetical protein
MVLNMACTFVEAFPIPKLENIWKVAVGAKPNCAELKDRAIPPAKVVMVVVYVYGIMNTELTPADRRCPFL